MYIILNEIQEYIYIYDIKNLTEFPLQVEIEAYNIQDIYDMNLKRLAQPQHTTRVTTRIMSSQTNKVQHELQFKSTNLKVHAIRYDKRAMQQSSTQIVQE